MTHIIALWNAKPLSWLVVIMALVAAPLTFQALRFLFAEQLEWLRAQRNREARATYCAELFCTHRPGYTVQSHQRTTRRYCFRHAICARAEMVFNGDTGTEILDAMLERHEARARTGRRELADMLQPRELPTWDRGAFRG
jgi:hypothetical protein